jgi:hypothetical protein
MIECPVCKKQCKNRLSYARHLHESEDVKHRKFEEELKKSIIKNFETLFICEIAEKNNMGTSWIKVVLLQIYSKQQMNEINLIKRKNKPLIHIHNNKCICAFCEKPFISHDKEPRKTCSKECQIANRKRINSERNKNARGKSLEELVGEERAKQIRQRRFEKSQKNDLEHEQHRLYCKCGKSRKFKKDIIEYICRDCKSDLNKYKMPCDNCGKEIKRYKKEIQEAIYTVKNVDGPVFFCSKECYLKYYRTHPERYKKQRQEAGLASVKSFREKENFVYAGIYFSSNTEMKCAQYIEKELKIVLAERQNCHVIINNIEVDFLVNNVVIEYHQCHRKTELTLKQRLEIWRNSFYKNKYRYEYRTLQEYYKCRKKKLPKEYKLIVVETERDFYKIKDMFK